MWYYKITDQQFGPFSKEEIQQLLGKGEITSTHFVWREGMKEWKQLGKTELNSLVSDQIHPLNSTSYEPMSSTCNTTQEIVEYFRPSSKVNPDNLKKSFALWALFLVILIIYEVFTNLTPSNSSFRALNCLGLITSCAFTAMSFLLLYHFWQINQDGNSYTTPGRAVGFMFIPVFNIYWIFRAFPGLSMDQNRYIFQHFSGKPEGFVKKAHPAIAFAYTLFSIFSSLFLIIYSVKQIVLTSVHMDSFDPTTLLCNIKTLTLLFWGFHLLLTILMYRDFYKTAMSILEVKEKNAQVRTGDS